MTRGFFLIGFMEPRLSVHVVLGPENQVRFSYIYSGGRNNWGPVDFRILYFGPEDEETL